MNFRTIGPVNNVMKNKYMLIRIFFLTKRNVSNNKYHLKFNYTLSIFIFFAILG